MRAEDKGEKLSALQAKKVRLVVLPIFFIVYRRKLIFDFKQMYLFTVKRQKKKGKQQIIFL